MTNDPYREARPSEGEGKTATKVTYWAELWRAMYGNAHGEALISPTFPSEAAAVSWIRAKRDDYEQIHLWKRTSRAGADFEDQALRTGEEPAPDLARMRSLVADIRRIAAGSTGSVAE
jgi:hypothetical protein